MEQVKGWIVAFAWEFEIPDELIRSSSLWEVSETENTSVSLVRREKLNFSLHCNVAGRMWFELIIKKVLVYLRWNKLLMRFVYQRMDDNEKDKLWLKLRMFIGQVNNNGK